jgi:ABC-type multidrug transport system fused ATPase/permease subunit
MSHLLRSSRMSYRDLLVTYLKPQWQRAGLMAVLLLASIGLQLVNPQILRSFIDAATSGGCPLGGNCVPHVLQIHFSM